MGQPDRADPGAITGIYEPYMREGFRHVHGYHHVHAYYELLIDNLLDLSHVDVVHTGILGVEKPRSSEIELRVEEDRLHARRACPNSERPPFLAGFFPRTSASISART
jgi:vanillate O-demethylase monooxygenase subunit